MNITNFNMRWATRSVRPAAAAGLALAALGASACGSDYARQGQASSYLIINRLAGPSVPAARDRAVHTPDVGRARRTARVFEDMGAVTMRAAMRDVTNPNGPTTNNADHGRPATA